MGLSATCASYAGTAPGEDMFKDPKHGCVNCHGANGNAPISTMYPKIGGQNAVYLAIQMKDIRKGKRDNSMTGIMRPSFHDLTDAQIDQIAQWLSTVGCESGTD